MKSQNATPSWGGRRKLPNAFTELGVSMLSSVLTTEIAIQANVQIMQAGLEKGAVLFALHLRTVSGFILPAGAFVILKHGFVKQCCDGLPYPADNP